MPPPKTIEIRVVPGYDAPNSVGVLAPAGTPREIVVKLQQEIARILAIREVQDRLLTAGIEPSSMKPEQFTEHIRAALAHPKDPALVNGFQLRGPFDSVDGDDQTSCMSNLDDETLHINRRRNSGMVWPPEGITAPTRD